MWIGSAVSSRRKTKPARQTGAPQAPPTPATDKPRGAGYQGASQLPRIEPRDLGRREIVKRNKRRAVMAKNYQRPLAVDYTPKVGVSAPPDLVERLGLRDQVRFVAGSVQGREAVGLGVIGHANHIGVVLWCPRHCQAEDVGHDYRILVERLQTVASALKDNFRHGSSPAAALSPTRPKRCTRYWLATFGRLIL